MAGQGRLPGRRPAGSGSGRRLPFGMTVRLLLFALYRDLVGTEALELALEPGATAASAVAAARGRGGAWSSLPEEPVVAVNLEYVDASHPLRDGDEVALLPPVAGG